MILLLGIVPLVKPKFIEARKFDSTVAPLLQGWIEGGERVIRAFCLR